ncbi:pSer/pThr/pTyr-binding forkhead associated (FHA) protein [Psychrobacter sp. PL15]|uniref:FHA domain-containing protein n=1 Tax=Psychrobacter sp. PL15 TaxID=3071719 RepID=UPI002E01F84E|nr:pSer/pThr/pTyr-binding forkhead associated (FHA) protein [Psychrobacter sp. PL15]
MTNNLENGNMTTADTEVAAAETNTWQLNALTAALGDLSLTVNESLSVGRGSDNDVVLGSKQVSRNHALLSVSNGKLYLKDLNSSNGTFINEERIESNKSEQVKADDTVGFASFSFQVIAPMATAFDTATRLEQPVEDSINLEPTTVDTLPTVATDNEITDNEITDDEIISEDVEDSETAAASVIAAENINSEVIKDKAISPIAEPEVIAIVEPTALVTPATVDPVVTNNTANANDVMTDSAKEDTVKDASVKNSTSIDSTVESDTAKDMTDVSQTEEPVVKETIIAEVLSSTASSSNASAPAIADVESEPPISSASMPSTAAEQETVISNDISKEPASTEPLNNESLNKEPLNKEPLNKETGVNEPVTSEPLVKEPTVHQEPAPHKQPIVTPEHDKTTKTALQEEADPDILRARQAATGQLTGTANLGRARDIGTEGNNALDQATNNSTNAEQVETKSSGGWFIWVLVAVVIIGLALWLFNMGGA